jgi:probable HAF family extracellular repeat protein
MKSRDRVTTAAVLFAVTLVGPRAFAAPPQGACAKPKMAKGSYQEVRVPGATDTEPSAINDRGDIVGAYSDAAGQVHGFLYRNGQFSTIHVPGSSTTVAVDINIDGTVVGNFDNHGYILRDQTFESIDAPGAFETSVTAINDQGVVTGLALEPNEFDGREVGFVRDADGTFERVVPDGSSSALVKDINNRQVLLVNANQGQLLRIDGAYQVIQPCRPLDTAFRITDRQDRVGDSEEPSLGMFVGYVQTATRYTTYRFPQSNQSQLRDVNASGTAVGQANDPVRGRIGFVFIPK